ncbi:MAG: hypothetical protein M1830_008585 [Pleopsidium flavum]|nr:MAG: hypothetical protein M1830_008585 [Pleopsidium flavum]
MDARWKNIPFKSTSEPLSPISADDYQYQNIHPDPRQDDGLHPAYSEHDRQTSAPEALGPPEVIRRNTTQLDPPKTLEDIAEQSSHDVKTPSLKQRIWQRHPRYWVWLLSVVSILGLALGLGIGLTIGRKVQGAMEGTGIVALDLGDDTTRITLYFQDRSGQIRQSQYKDGIWTGGTPQDTVVTSNARPGTPLMALSYAHNNELTWRVFYIDKDNILQESLNSNKTTGWASGFLGTSNFKTSPSANVGLTACVLKHWYGDPLGIRLYYGSAEGSVQELTWNFGDGAWGKGYTFPDSNPHGGCECTVRGSSITNVWLLNTNGELEQRWRDFNLSAISTGHPTGTWVKQLTYHPIHPNTSLSAINLPYTKNVNVHVQSPSNTITQLVATGVAETSIWGDSFPVGTVKGMQGTKIGSVVLKTTEGGQEIHVFFQEEGGGSGVVDFIRTLVGGTWARVVVPVGA